MCPFVHCRGVLVEADELWQEGIVLRDLVDVVSRDKERYCSCSRNVQDRQSCLSHALCEALTFSRDSGSGVQPKCGPHRWWRQRFESPSRR